MCYFTTITLIYKVWLRVFGIEESESVIGFSKYWIWGTGLVTPCKLIYQYHPIPYGIGIVPSLLVSRQQRPRSARKCIGSNRFSLSVFDLSSRWKLPDFFRTFPAGYGEKRPKIRRILVGNNTSKKLLELLSSGCLYLSLRLFLFKAVQYSLV
jgi:hypothetical protein